MLRRQGEEFTVAYTYFCHIAKQRRATMQPRTAICRPTTTAPNQRLYRYYYPSPTNATVQACMHPLQAANRLLAALLILQDFRIGKMVRGQAQVQKKGHP